MNIISALGKELKIDILNITDLLTQRSIDTVFWLLMENVFR